MDETPRINIEAPFNTNAIKGGFAVYFGLGSLNTFGNICIYVINYMRIFGQDTQVAYKNCVFIYSILVIIQSIAAVVGCYLEQNIGPKDTIITGTLLMIFGYLISYWTVSSMFFFTLSYSIICGVGSGICYPVPMSVAIKCNKRKEGYSCGYIHLGGGLSTIIFTPLQLMWMNPNLKEAYLEDNFENIETSIQDIEILSHLPTLFILEAIVIGIIQYYGARKIGIAAYEHSIWDKESIYDKYIEPVSNFFGKFYTCDPLVKVVNQYEEDGLLGTEVASKSITTSDLLSSIRFYRIYLSMLFSWQSVIMAHTYWKILGIHRYKLMDGELSNVALSCAIASLSGRVFWGVISDKYGWRMSWCSIILMVIGLSLTFSVRLMHNIFVYGFWVTMIYFAHSGCYTLAPLATSDIFGSKNFAPAFGLLSTTRALAGIITALLTFIIGSIYSFELMPFFTAIMSIASLLLFKSI